MSLGASQRRKSLSGPEDLPGEGLAILLGGITQFASIEIWVVARCKAPIIVRESEHGKLNGLPRCIPFFNCYVHVVMDGEKTNNHWDKDTSLLMLR